MDRQPQPQESQYEDKYFRFSYNGIGVYEALKREIWNVSDNPKEEWEKLKKLDAFTWLKVPNIYPDESYSYFTEDGYKVFMDKTYPLFIKYLKQENIVFEKFEFNKDELNIVYEDEHQIVVKMSQVIFYEEKQL